jgi:hypothetical protein
MSRHYILNPDGSYRKASFREYYDWEDTMPGGKPARWVAKTTRCGYNVSTVFLGTFARPPIMFQTMLSGRVKPDDSIDQEFATCTSYAEALAQHHAAVERVRLHVGEWKWFWGRWSASEWYRIRPP